MEAPKASGGSRFGGGEMFDVRERSTRSWQNSSQQARRREARAGVHDSHFFGAIECGVGPCKPAVHGPGSDLGWRYRHFQVALAGKHFFASATIGHSIGSGPDGVVPERRTTFMCLFFFCLRSILQSGLRPPQSRWTVSSSQPQTAGSETKCPPRAQALSQGFAGKGWGPMAKGAITPYRHSHREDRGSSETRTGHGVADLEPSRDVALRFLSGPLPTTRHDARPNTTGNIHVQRGQGQQTCSLHITSVKFIRRRC